MTSHPVPLKASYYAWMDGARGLAVAGVLVFHFSESGGFKWSTALYSLTSLGWAGVDLFFVLSGFLITGILAGRRRGASGLLGFYRDRALRIMPLYYTVVLVALFAFNQVYVDQAERLRAFNRSIPDLLFFMQNWLPAQIQAIYLQFGMNHLWSLAVEMQFYLVWPLAILVTPRRYWIALVLSVLVVAVGTRLYSSLILNSPSVSYFSTFTRLDSFMGGALVFVLGVVRSRKKLAIIGIATGFSLLLACAFSDQSFQPKGLWMRSIGYTANVLIFGSFLLWMLGDTSRTRTVNSMLSFAPLRRLGEISYGVYVLHYPILFAALHFSGISLGLSKRTDVVFLTLWVVLTVSVAELSFRYLEAPFLKLKRPAPRDTLTSVGS